MNFFSMVAIAASLSIDSLVVSASYGLSQMDEKFKRGMLISNIFALVQTLFVFGGFFVGSLLVNFIQSVDHWVALILLTFIGCSMIREAIKDDNESNKKPKNFSVWVLIGVGVSISGDDLTAGVTFAFLSVDMIALIIIVELVTLGLSILGFYIGDKIGERFEKWSKIIAGFVIITLGIIILLEHLL